MYRSMFSAVVGLWIAMVIAATQGPCVGASSDNQVTSKPQAELKLPETITPEELEFLGSHSHRFHARGLTPAPPQRERAPRFRAGDPEKRMDQAWIVMLYKQGIITREMAAKVLVALEKSPVGGEDQLKKVLDGDEDTASMTQYGRTRQEPMTRLAVRQKQLDVIDATQDCLEEILNTVERYADTIMPGTSHMADAQPTTYGAYLLAVHDGVYRGLEHLELAYKHTNENSGGCGATSGSGWPVDRYMVTELLGFDKLVEPTYDGEAGQDFAMNTLFATSNMLITLSRTAMDHAIWGMDHYGTHTLPSRHIRVSSLMPHKAHPGCAYEWFRIWANDVIGTMTTGMLGLKGEPFSDVLPSYGATRLGLGGGATGALAKTETAMVSFTDIMRTVIVNEERLLQFTRDGWSCTPDLAVKLIRDKGYGSRRAHRICAVMVRIARDHRKLKPYEVTGAMLDEAARVANEKEPHLSTEEIREIMDPVKFIERHNNTGDPNPKETARMVKIRREQLAQSRQQQAQRRARVEAGFKKLDAEIAAILGK